MHAYTDHPDYALFAYSPEWAGRLAAVAIAVACGRTAPTYITFEEGQVRP